MSGATLLLAPLLLQVTPSPRAPVFASRVDMVRVDVLVLRNQRPVTGLQVADFEVRDEGVRQEIELASGEDVPTHIVLALDTSSSVAGEKLARLKAAARALLSDLRPVDRATLVTFSHSIRVKGPVGAPPADVLPFLDQVAAEGTTALFDVLYASLALIDPRLGRSAVVVFSDGADRTSWLSSDELLVAAKASDAVVYAVVPPGEAPDRREPPPFSPGSVYQSEDRGRAPVLRSRGPDWQSRVVLADLAEQTGGLVWEARGGLEDAFLQVLHDIRSRYILRYEPRGVSRRGWHRLDVRVKGIKADVRARLGYFASQE